jgi:hypothetical protein
VNLNNFADYVYTNRPGYSRDYKGLELTWRKRMSNSFMANGSVTVQDTIEHWPAGSFEDPTNIVNRDGGQYAPEVGGSGIDNVFPNARWLGRLSASYTLPWQQVNLAATYEVRDGYPLPLGVQTPARGNGASPSQFVVYLQKLGENRLGKYNNLNLRVSKAVKIHGSSKVDLSVDVFNAFNNDTILSRRRTQNAANANLISQLVAPRVVRFGARMTW